MGLATVRVVWAMANKAKPGRFTEAELELMDILWDSGACTVQGVIDRLPPSRPLAYTTVQTVLNVLHRGLGVASLFLLLLAVPPPCSKPGSRHTPQVVAGGTQPGVSCPVRSVSRPMGRF